MSNHKIDWTLKENVLQITFDFSHFDWINEVIIPIFLIHSKVRIIESFHW